LGVPKARCAGKNSRHPPMNADQVSSWSVPLQSVAWASRPKESGATGGVNRMIPTLNKTVSIHPEKEKPDFTD
jgi:hypothetical protein